MSFRSKYHITIYQKIGINWSKLNVGFKFTGEFWREENQIIFLKYLSTQYFSYVQRYILVDFSCFKWFISRLSNPILEKILKYIYTLVFHWSEQYFQINRALFQNANKQKVFILILIFKNKIQKGAQNCRSTDFPYKLRIYCWVSFLPLNIRSSFQYFSQHSIRTNFFPLKVFYMLPFRKKLQNHEKLKHFIFNKYSNFGSIYQENK